jgi:hypothetical protein
MSTTISLGIEETGKVEMEVIQEGIVNKSNFSLSNLV